MGKTRKRQRTIEKRPLGSTTTLDEDASKDEEERRLESLLFGKTFVPATAQTKTGFTLGSADTHEVESDTGGGLGHLLDSDLFFFDDAWTSAALVDTANPHVTVAESTDNEIGDASPTTSKGPLQTETQRLAANMGKTDEPLERVKSSFRKKQAAWVDPDDANIHVSLASDKRLRKLRDAPQEDAIGGRDYESRLRRHYEKIHPIPEWATNARKQLLKKKRRRVSNSSASESSDSGEAVTSLLSSSGALLSSRRQTSLPKGHLSIERLRDANQAAKADGDVKSVKFHPSPSVSVLLSASADRRLRLFNIDGHTNPHLQTVHIPKLPISSAVFHPTGSSVLLTGRVPFYYTYDLKAGTCIQSPRRLWGGHTSNINCADLSMEICAFSNTGDVLAVAGRRGYIHLIDWRTGGAQVLGSVKMNATVMDIWWTGEGRLMSLAEDAEVYLWDIGERRCARRWKDDGGFGSVRMTGSAGDVYLAIGAKSGLVNLYGPESMVANTSDVPKPLKTIGNLTTSISSMRFNHDAQILALTSAVKKDQLKMAHFPSMTVFSNWPTAATPLGHVTSMDFSAGSEYAAFGNNRGRVLLYSLRHFTSI